MKSYNCFIGRVPVKLELDKKGFWAKYRKSKMTPEVEKVLDKISNAEDVSVVLEGLIEKGELRIDICRNI